MIKIDEYTEKQIGYPIPRDQYGAVMTLLSNSGAKAVALDMFLTDKQEVDSTENALHHPIFIESTEHVSGHWSFHPIKDGTRTS